MEPPVKVYGSALLPGVSRVLACLFEKKVEFQLLAVSVGKGEHKKREFLRTKSFGHVPEFEDESVCLVESRAICRYVSEKYANQGNKDLYGTNQIEKDSIDRWLKYEEENFDPPSSELVFQLAFAPPIQIKQDEGLIRQSEEKLKKVLNYYEKWLGKNRYLAGDKFTLADLSHLPNTQYLAGLSHRDKQYLGRLITSRKNVARWWDEISNRESWKNVLAMQK